MRDDDALMLAYRDGEVGAYNTLVERYRARVYGFAMRITGDPQLAEDVLIEALFRVHRSAPRYNPKGRFREWLFQITYRVGLDQMAAHRKLTLSDRREDDQIDPMQRVPDGAASPEEQTMHRRALVSLNATLAHLPEKQRAAFLLYYGEGMTTEEIARTLEIGQSSVRAYLTTARQLMRGSNDLGDPNAPERRPQ